MKCSSAARSLLNLAKNPRASSSPSVLSSRSFTTFSSSSNLSSFHHQIVVKKEAFLTPRLPLLQNPNADKGGKNRFCFSVVSLVWSRLLSSSSPAAIWSVAPNTSSIMDRSSVKKDSVGSLSSVGTNGSGQSANVGSATGSKMPFMIGVAGGTASGKTTVCEKIMEAVHGSELEMGHEKNIVVISEDSFYRELDNKESVQAERGLFNFDHPDALDNELLMSCLADIRDGKMTRVPVYDFKTNSRVKGQYTVVYPSDVVLLEGILVFYHKDVRDMFDMKLFVDTDADTRLSRRVLRDIEERGRDLEHVLHQYTTLVKPAFEEFCLPTKKHADVIIPRGADNTVAVSLVAQHIQDIIWRRNGGCDCSAINTNGSGGKASSPAFERSRSSSESMVR